MVPNPQLENCFLAHAYDLKDPWGGVDGSGVKCNSKTVDKNYDCTQPWFMGPGIHPRLKKPVGARLAFAAHSLVYSASNAPVTGPTISGCTVSSGKLTVLFNDTLLGSSELHVLPYRSEENSAFSVAAQNGSWYAANISLSSSNTIDVDISFLGSERPSFIRYAWGETGGNPVGDDVDCCNGYTSAGECIPGVCPLVAKTKGVIFGTLPANPFLAKITEQGKCLCPSPQKCDA